MKFTPFHTSEMEGSAAFTVRAKPAIYKPAHISGTNLKLLNTTRSSTRAPAIIRANPAAENVLSETSVAIYNIAPIKAIAAAAQPDIKTYRPVFKCRLYRKHHSLPPFFILSTLPVANAATETPANMPNITFIAVRAVCHQGTKSGTSTPTCMPFTRLERE